MKNKEILTRGGGREEQKKIAIQLYGHLRTFKDTYESFFSNIVKPNEEKGYKVDIFIHTWDHNTQRIPDNITKITNEQIDFIKSIYKPKKILIETQKKVKNKKYKGFYPHFSLDKPIYVNYVNLYNQYYTLYKANELRTTYEKETNTKYDYVLATRFDILFDAPLIIENIVKESKCECILSDTFKDTKYNEDDMPLFTTAIMHNYYKTPIKFLDPSALPGADITFFSIPKNINKITSLFLHLDKILEEKGFWNHKHFWYNFSKSQNLKMQVILYGKFEIKRITEEKFRLSNILRLVLNKHTLSLQILNKLSLTIFNFKLNFFDKAIISFSIGKVKS